MATSNIKARSGSAARSPKRASGDGLTETRSLDTGELQAILGFRLREAWAAMERYFVECFREEKVTPASYAILVVVAANPGCLASEICAVTSISSANIIPYIDELIERGFIRRELGIRDRRVKHLHLTEEGARRLDIWRRIEKRLIQHFQKKLGPQNLPRFIEWLAIMAEAD
jgi:DNA-binding MarR family transcriptional regulator